MKKTLAFTVVFLIATFAFWLYGFDFDRRGEMLGAWFAVSTIIALLGTLFFKNEKSKKNDNQNKFIIIYAWVLLFIQITAWLGGLNLPGRSPELVVWIFGSLFYSLIISGTLWVLARIRSKIGQSRESSQEDTLQRSSTYGKNA